MPRKATCLVTIHGIGFQQPPLNDGTPGYADRLHESLHEYLKELLSDDPDRRRKQAGEKGPIYVQSHWPPGTLRTEPGLERLGRWRDDQRRSIDIKRHPLLGKQGSIAHVALVYANEQDLVPRPGSALGTLARSGVNFHRYATLPGALYLLIADTLALIPRPRHPRRASPSLRIRIRDRSPAQIIENQDSGLPSSTELQFLGAPDNPIAVISQLLNDVATYVSRDDLQTRVRSFVHDAVLRLCCREDVERLIINAHSLGSVVAFDVLRQLPPFALHKVALLITEGCPLRKFADLFAWGDDAGCLYQIPAWVNFWDRRDPVADPLQPPPSWRRGRRLPKPLPGESMFHGIVADTGDIEPIAIQDRRVCNISHTPAGAAPAHNYWDNEPQFVKPVATVLRQLVTAGRITEA